MPAPRPGPRLYHYGPLRRSVSLATGIALILAAALATAAPASALPGPSTLATGFGADTLAFDGAQQPAWFSRLAQLGSSWVRIPVPWNAIAPATRPRGFKAANPADPHYNWYSVDAYLRDAAAFHQHALLMLSSPPSWALGRGAPRGAFPGTWRPSPSAFGAFAHAVAERYSGRFPDPFRPGHKLPRVSYFQAWNEPNLPTLLEPQWTRTQGRYVPASPTIYRALLNSMYAAVKSVQPRAHVLAAGLAPYGDPPGDARMHPMTFLDGLLCLSDPGLHPQPCRHPAHFDAVDIHPYGVTPTHRAFNRDDVSVADIGKLARALAAAGRTGRALPAGPKPIWVSEIDWDSAPDPGGVSLAEQASYLSRAFYVLWRQGVSHVMWYEPHDLIGNPRGSALDGGLFTNGGQPKPSSVAFGFPFVALRGAGGLTTLWGRAPRAGHATVEVARGATWRRLLTVTTTRGGVFYVRRRLGTGLMLRAVSGAVASYPWVTG